MDTTTTSVDSVTPIRNPAATTTGAGLAILLAWIYNSIIAPRFALAEMPEAVVIVLSMIILDAVRYFMSRDHVVGDEVKVVTPVKTKKRVKRVTAEPMVILKEEKEPVEPAKPSVFYPKPSKTGAEPK